MLGEDLGDTLGPDTVDFERVASGRGDDGAGAGEHGRHLGGSGRAHDDRRRHRVVEQGAHRRVGDEATAVDDHDPVGKPFELTHEVRREQHDATLVGAVAKEPAQPHHPLGVEAVHRFVEDEDARVADEGGGDAEPLAHAQRVATDPPIGRGIETDEGEQLLGSRRADPVRAAQPAQVSCAGQARIDRAGVEDGADGGERPRQLPRVIVLTTFDLDEYVYDALSAGASGFLLKDVTAETLFDAVRVVAAGDALLTPNVTRRLIDEFARIRPRPRDDRLAELTAREIDVLRLVAAGRSNTEIAAELYVGVETVKTHVSRILTKLAARDRTQAVIAAYESGLVRPSS